MDRLNNVLNRVSHICPEPPALHHRTHAEFQRQRGRSDAAESAARRVLRRDRNCARSWEALGAILAGHGELVEAGHCFAAAVQIDPRDAQALNNLAVVLQRLGQLPAAEARYRQALLLVPGDLDIQLNVAALRGALGCYREGLEIVEQVLLRRPEMVPAHLLASALEVELGRYPAALARVEFALAIAPGQANILTRRAWILLRLGRSAAALETCRDVLGKDPNDAAGLRMSALALQGLDQPTEALHAFRSAEAVSAMPAAIITERAWLLAEMGHKVDSMAALDQALSLEPNLATAWHCRASQTSYTRGHPDLAIMEGIADNPNTPHADRLRLCFAIGKAYLDTGDGAQAFVRLDIGNHMKRAILDYDPDADARRFAEIASIFSAETLSRFAGRGDASSRPIFVFGMPRSGTTLVEQILASHRSVHGTGEPSHLADIAQVPGFLAGVPDMAPRDFAEAGGRYLDLLGAGVPDGLRLVDKATSNFLYAGLISLILPGARMIHCRRDPLDTCLSCYSLLFSSGQEFSYDLAELGRYYRMYRKLTGHWRRVLSPASFMEVDYETLVNDTEGEVCKILDFCALPWDPSCLRFHETKRRVTSASFDQVRSPVYTTSVGRARAFRPWLGALQTALADLPPNC